MLEFKQLTKIYQTDGETETRALDGVSVSFGETGLVFLLGKSGSGKSTMLNLAGGLDAPTSGEIVVMGKSSKDFSESDFDSYRNTYVGFVFQEYNVLEEFSVEENVALALELQGSINNDEKVRRILDEVELGEFAKRKPNTLSGGQKQRVAIARALVKEPKIILADEPTGALDSETGKQVFETLKKLSASRLVVVVSHDRDFAETYGDRIIELKDGKIISDVCRVYGNFDVIEKHNMLLDEKLFDRIRTFVADDGTKTYNDFIRFENICSCKNTFEPTPPQTLGKYDENSIKLIRSKLPFRKAFKIGASGLKLKPMRLTMTIILSIIAFVMFGILSTLMFYNFNSVLAGSIKESGLEYVAMEKNHIVRNTNYDDSIYESTNRAYITPDDVAARGESALGAYRLKISGSSNIGAPRSDYYMLSLRYVAPVPQNHPFRGENFEGRYPTEANEIAVSSYFLEVLKNSTFTRLTESGALGAKKKIEKASDIIGERVFISSIDDTFIITGIFDSGNIPDRFDRLKQRAYDKSYRQLLSSYSDYIASSAHSLVLVSDEFCTRFESIIGDACNEIDYFNGVDNDYNFKLTTSGETKLLFDNGRSRLRIYSSEPDAFQRPITFFDEKKNTIGEREVILHIEAISSYYAFLADDLTIETDRAAYDNFASACNALMCGRLANLKEIDEKKAIIRDYVVTHPIETLTLVENGREKGTATVVGFYRAYKVPIYGDGFYCSQTFYEEAGPRRHVIQETKYRCEENAVYDFIICSPEKSDSNLLAFAKMLGEKNANAENDVFYSLDSLVYDDVVAADKLVEVLSIVLIVTGIVLAIFSALLLFNFISVSISSKKKEIGILRAVGARGADVFKIFFSESGIIVGICIVFSIACTVVLAVVLNYVIRAKLGLIISIFIFGPLSAVTMIVIAVVVAVLATLFPVYSAAKKKPVDSIRAL